jgi:hypothetical protein
MNSTNRRSQLAWLVLAASLLACPAARADAVTDWNARIDEIVTAANVPNHPAARAYAGAHTAVYEAVNAITKRYPASELRLDAPAGASVDAAVAAASRVALLKLLPAQQPAIDNAYNAAVGKVADGPGKSAGLEVGEKAAAAVLARRGDDGASIAERYRPHTTAGTYVPTAIPLVPQWPQRKPWLMSSPSQFRPGPPPALTSEIWARDFNEVKAFGGRDSTRRTAEQTEIARFWETSGPAIYSKVARSVANAPGREVTRNARLFAALSQASDDAFIAIFDAKYHYNLWRPITAIRNGDIDGNDATERDPSWVPLINTPMHPEYPCAHCIIAATVGTVLQADVGAEPMPVLSTSSPTAKGATRSWTKVDDLVQEVSLARIYDGVHYRTSTEVANTMGKQVGGLAATKYLRRPD